jgi:UDP-N-acetylmuramyl pentapeptide phosphotransferase/UDP-N-acetylglucosamine-1-phosphate transferase
MISSIILFFTGIYDDIMNMRPSRKLLAQLSATFISVAFTQYRLPLDAFPALAGMGDWAAVLLTVLAATFFINVFNFIDGIDGLACTSAIVYLLVLGVLNLWMGITGQAGLAFTLAGASAGLLYYNFSPARVYMGDTGSMLLGFSIFLVSLLTVGQFRTVAAEGALPVLLRQLFPTEGGFSAFIVALIFLPVFDAVRVFALRLSRGISPLRADRNHLHYFLLDAGFSHTTALAVLMAANAVNVAAALLLARFHPLVIIGAVTLLCLLLTGFIALRRKAYQATATAVKC